MRNAALLRVGRNHHQRNARAVSEEVQRIHVAGVIVATAFVDGHENRRALPEFGVRLHRFHDLLHKPFEQVPLRRSGVPVHPAARLHERHLWQRSLGNVRIEVGNIFKVVADNRRVGHDLLLVVKTIADVAILIAVRTDGAVVQLILIVEICIPLIVVAFPGNVVLNEHIGDAALGRRRNGEGRVARVRIGVGIAAIPEVAWVVVVQQVIVPRIAIRLDRPRQRCQIVEDRPNSRLGWIGAVRIGTAAIHSRRAAESTKSPVAILNPEVLRSRLRVRVFDLIDRTACPGHLVVRRRACREIGIAEPDSVAEEEHDAIETGSALRWLVVVIADRVVIREILRVGRVSPLHVVEAHRCCALVRCRRPRRIIRVEIRRLRLAVVVRAHGHFRPREKV